MTTSSHNPQVKAVINELSQSGIPYQIEHGSKHIIIRYEVNGTKHVTTVGRGSRQSVRNLLNARADTRRRIKQGVSAHVPHQDPSPEEPSMSQLTLTEQSLQLVGDTPRMRDTDIAHALGFTRPDNIRNLIKANIEEMQSFGEVCFAEKQTSERGGRPSQAYLLNRDQTILAAILSRAPGASTVRQQVIQAYNDWNQHHAEPAQAALPKMGEPEIMLNEPAINAITEAVVSRLSSGGQMAQTDMMSRDDMRDILTQFFNWQRGQFEDISNKLSSTHLLSGPTTGDIETFLSEKIGEIKDRMDENSRYLSRSIQEQLAGSVAIPATPVPEATPEVEAEKPKDGLEGVVAPQVEAQEEPAQVDEEYVSLSNIYKMAGINAAQLPERGRLSSKVRFSMERYSKKAGVEPKSVKKYGITSMMWPKSFAADWYRTEGSKIIRSHLIGRISTELA